MPVGEYTCQAVEVVLADAIFQVAMSISPYCIVITIA
jgi:hypothetical protein